MNVRNAYLVSSLGHAGVLTLGFALASLVHTPAIVPGVHIVLGGAGAPAGGGKPGESKVPPKPAPPKPTAKSAPEVEPPRPQQKKVEDKAPPQREAAKPASAHGAKPARDAGIISKAPSAPVTVAAANPSPPAANAANASGSKTGPGSGRGGRGEVGVEAEGEAGPAAGYLSLLRERVATAWEPPLTIERVGEARVVVMFTVLVGGGRPEDLKVQSSSGVSLFDRKALAAVADAAPLPPIPSHLGFGSIVIRFTFTQQY